MKRSGEYRVYIPTINEIRYFLHTIGYTNDAVNHFIEQIKHFEEEAPKRDEIVKGYLTEGQIRTITNSIVSEIEPVEEEKLDILDIGAGSGFFTVRLRETLKNLGFPQINIYGLDLCPSMLKILVERGIVPLWGIAEHLIECIKLMIENHNLRVPNKFDYVISILAFHHFIDPEKALSNIKGIVKPNGKVVIVDITKYDNEELRRKLRDSRPGFELEEIGFMAKKHFREVKVEVIKGVKCCTENTSVELFKATLTP